jgi:4-hydroxy-tetrahydrodipicolinate reductase
MNATTATSSSNNQRLRVAVAGASGRMGRMLIEAILQSDDLALTAALDRPDSPALGTDPSAFLGQPSGIAIESDVRAALSRADCLIDFTRPEGTMDHLAICAELGVKLVIGTTGFSDEQKARIAEYARRTAVMLSPNMSVGVNVTFKLLEMAAKALSSGYDIEIVEAHHRHKVDAPSASPPCAAATSSATTPCCSPARASASRSRTSPAAAPATRRAACVPRASWQARPAASTTCTTY